MAGLGVFLLAVLKRSVTLRKWVVRLLILVILSVATGSLLISALLFYAQSLYFK